MSRAAGPVPPNSTLNTATRINAPARAMPPLIRKHAVMTLKPGCIEPYRASHNEGFWPEMGEMLKAHGAHNYAISLLEEPAGSGGGRLFATLEIESEERWAAVKDTDVCKRWWKWMKEFIVFNADGTPQATELKELFFLP